VAIRILLARMPRMVCDILREVLDAQPDMRVVAELGNGQVLSERVAAERPDVVIVGLERDEPPAICGELLSDHPRVRIVAVEESGRRASLYELRPTCTVLHELSGDELVASIRRAVQPMPLVAAGGAPARAAGGAFVRLTPLDDGGAAP
jgi:DNA-binding NarL/FixJ family response regulator